MTGDEIDAIPADTSTGAVLSPGGTLRSDIGFRGDEDWIRVALEAGRSYQFDLMRDAASYEPLFAPLLSLHDASGALIVTAEDGGELFNDRLVYTPAQDEIVFASAQGEIDVYTGSYLLSVV